MSDPAPPGAPGALSEDVTGDGVFRVVLEGYDAVYDALPRGETFSRLWRLNAYGGDFPEQFAHIGFLTAEETPGWQDRVYAAFRAIAENNDTLIAEMGEPAAASALTEALITLQIKPYPRRIMAVASRPG